ncbi:hypothetical protein BCV70DRAFT_217795 [Testicularia cyperi]|uniref:Glutamate--cysteine ligase modifier subunit n=1 Tax=Testicularia cyperi TaxID=1882483 RepID=A0A317XNI0_9BASI|nr:hypothetical protein BCV70DRAFT_217795 [Testicularia cyperi]
MTAPAPLVSTSTPSSSAATPSMDSAASTSASRSEFRSLYIHTHDVSRSLKPSADGELAHAIHQTLHFALDGHPDDYTVPTMTNGGAASGCDPLATMPSAAAEGANGDQGSAGPSNPASASSRVKKGFFPTQDAERPYISYFWDPKSATMALPNPQTISNPVADPCSQDHRSSYEITAKFFFLDPNDLSSDLVEDALRRLTNTTGIITIDTLVLAFPSLHLDARSVVASDAVDKVRNVWETVSINPQLFSLGLSDISQPNLESLLSSFQPPLQPPSMPLMSPAIPLSSSSTQPSQSSTKDVADSDVDPDSLTSHTNQIGGQTAPWNLEYSLPSTARRPRLVTINVNADPCAFDKPLEQFCANMGVQLVAHSDRKDVLPSHTLPNLLQEFTDKLPVNPSATAQLKPKWALKYTTLIRDRGVLADKGYVIYFTST